MFGAVAVAAAYSTRNNKVNEREKNARRAERGQRERRIVAAHLRPAQSLVR